MKTRRSLSNEKSIGKVEAVEEEKVNSQPIIRTLRSRVITSDNEDEVRSNKRTPKKRYSRGKVDETPLPTESNEVDGEKTFKSPSSCMKKNPVVKLFKITESREELENEGNENATEVNVEEENSCSQEDRPLNHLNQELIKEPPVSYDKDTVKEEPKISSNEKGRKKASFSSPSLPHVVSPRKSFGFIEEPMEDIPKDTSPPFGSMKKIVKAEVVEESEDDGTDSDSKMTESVPLDSVKGKTYRAKEIAAEDVLEDLENLENKQQKRGLEAERMQKAINEPVDATSEDTSSSDSSMNKPAEKDTLAKKSSSIETEEMVESSDKSEDGESDDDKVTESLPSESEDLISTAMSMTASPIKKEMEEEKEQWEMKKKVEVQRVKKEPVENLCGASVLQDSSVKISQKEVMKAGSGESEDDESDTDEEMPESVTFESGKEQTNRALILAAEAIRKEKEKRKEQQKKRMDMIKQQKAEKERKHKEKLKHLEANLPERLDEDVVCRLPDAPKIPTIRPTEPQKKKKRHVESSEEQADEMEEKPVAKKNKIYKFDDYIPIDNVEGATKFGVVPLEVVMRIPKSASETAAEFKRQALYGSRIKREPSKSLLMYKQKMIASGKDRGWVHHQQKHKFAMVK